MIIKKAEFITSAANRGGFIVPDRPMIAVAGRSNVGKSSFINMLANRNKLAKTSSEPGRTRLVNYFDFGEFLLADLPGYGFARVGFEEKRKWSRTLEDFFAGREHLSHLFFLVDIRHAPSADDLDMLGYLYHYIIPFTVIATKADKLAKTRVRPAICALAAQLKLAPDNIIAVSNNNGYGKAVVLTKLDEIIANALSQNDSVVDDGDGEDAD